MSERKQEVEFQAHRGGGIERPENTLESFSYGWSLGGIVETDLRETRDGLIVCLHDPTLARTTDAPADIANVPVGELRHAEFAKVDAGRKFSPAYTGQRVPLLREVFTATTRHPDRRMYLDLKGVDPGRLAALVREFGFEERMYTATSELQDCGTLKRVFPSVRTMLWCEGSAEEIGAKFREVAEADFPWLDQVQFHLNDAACPEGWRYEVSPPLLRDALEITGRRGVDFQVAPWRFDARDIEALLEAGVRWFATDEPGRFVKAVEAWLAARGDCGR